MPCSIDQRMIDQTIAFHGHCCPGLVIGIRAAELALREFGGPGPELVAVSETDMCGCDAIQFLTGCTYGKGNFIHRDFGKMAFSFFDRRTGKGFRAVLKPESRRSIDEQVAPLMEKQARGALTDGEAKRLQELRGDLQAQLLGAELGEVFDVTKLDQAPPRPARILRSLTCAHCREQVMESRSRRFAGETLCIPCFEKVEQKV
jgi:formylmethanofuran dehydrogenase subunit E